MIFRLSGGIISMSSAISIGSASDIRVETGIQQRYEQRKNADRPG
jgi:hypothetical protein